MIRIAFMSLLVLLNCAICFATDVVPATQPDIATLREKARAGDGMAMLMLGQAYCDAESSEFDPSLAYDCFMSAAEAGEVHAYELVGKRYLLGVGVPANTELALAWFYAGATAGSGSCHRLLADHFFSPEAETWSRQLGLNHLSHAVELGDAQAVTKLAELLIHGTAVPKNLKASRALLESASDAGYIPAKTILGAHLILGTFAPSDLQRGLELLNQAAESGHPDAINALIIFHAQDVTPPGPRDHKIALRWAKHEAVAEFQSSNAVLGLAYLKGELVERDATKGLAHLRKAADMGNTYVQHLTGLILLHGDASGTPVPVDSKTGLNYILQAASAGETDSIVYLLNFNRVKELKPHVDEGPVPWIDRLMEIARNGNHVVAYHLGIAFYYGNSVPKDFRQAELWLSQSAEAGHLPAIKLMALADYHKQLPGSSTERLIRLLETGAAQDDLHCLAMLFEIYNTKVLLPQTDIPLAFHYLEKSAELGDVDACYRLGLSHFLGGLGQSENKRLGIEWLEKAAALGSREAMFRLNAIYRNGDGTAADETKAKAYEAQWAQSAAANRKKSTADNKTKPKSILPEFSQTKLIVAPPGNSDDFLLVQPTIKSKQK